LLAVNILDQSRYLLANLEDLLRALYAAPGHLGNVEQAVRAAKIDERAEIGYVLHHALDSLADSDPLKQSLLHLSFSRKDELLAVADHSSSLGIELGDYKFDLLSRVLGQILFIRIGNQACRNKDRKSTRLNSSHV